MKNYLCNSLTNRNFIRSFPMVYHNCQTLFFLFHELDNQTLLFLNGVVISKGPFRNFFSLNPFIDNFKINNFCRSKMFVDIFQKCFAFDLVIPCHEAVPLISLKITRKKIWNIFVGTIHFFLISIQSNFHLTLRTRSSG